ncbi:cytochrome P450 [Microdochium bolleyi]|uniref:Cytochrome P450 n=1 Tax=Microdochium bolleyi TaxID=196109 RepID=A0A136IYW6_9PEZI|nr:cytochrome P450 [Microdochium bolleyi]
MGVLVQSVQWYWSQSSTACAVEALTLALLAWRVLTRLLVKLPPGAPPLYKEGSGVLGSQEFVTSRANYLAEGIRQSITGQFSFWHGGNHIVVVSGEAARTSFQTARGLDPGAGFAALFGSFLDISELTRDSMRRAMLIYKRCTQTDHLATSLHHLVSDCDSYMRNIRSTTIEKGGLAVVDAQKFLGLLMFQLTHRVAGVHEIANDPSLLRETWNVYTPLEDSPYIDILMPWLPTPSKMRKIWGYAKLHFTVSRIARERKAAGRTEHDMLQMLMDADLGIGMQSLSVIGAVLAGVFNTTFSTVYNICCLAVEHEWLERMRAEIDTVIESQRALTQRPTAPLVEILQTLTVHDWETRFPILRAAIAESIRFTMAGAVVRKNISPNDLEIGDTGFVIPQGSLAVHATADTHMDESLYPNPLTWDPRRFMGDRPQGSDVAHGYLGWGSGKHTCPARRFAELNVLVATVMFIAHFDFHVCDRTGNDSGGPLPPIMYNRMGAGQLQTSVFLACRGRL